MKELNLIRHGETAWNAEHRLQGHLDIPLNPTGHAQARALGVALAQIGIEEVISSDLQRARQTAEAVAQACGGLSVSIDAALRERCFGAFEGMLYADVEGRYPEAHAAWQRRDPEYRFPAGQWQAETLEEFYARSNAAVLAVLARSSSRAAQGKLAIVCHGGVLDCIYRAARGLSLAAERDVAMLNASINRLSWDGNRLSVLAWGDVAHLAASALDEASR